MPDESQQHIVTLENAYQTHLSWKAKLFSIAKKGEMLDVALIKRDDCCELGVWLSSERNGQYANRHEFQNLIDKHREFHVVASIVASVANKKDLSKLSDHMNDSSHFASASIAVGVAIKQLKTAIAS